MFNLNLIQSEAEFLSIYKKDKWLGKGSYGEVYRLDNMKHCFCPDPSLIFWLLSTCLCISKNADVALAVVLRLGSSLHMCDFMCDVSSSLCVIYPSPLWQDVHQTALCPFLYSILSVVNIFYR